MFSVSILALSLTLVLVVLVRPIAINFGLVDQPCTRKRHDGVIPLIGGVVIYISLFVTSLVFPCWNVHNGLGMMFVALPVLLIGMADDRWSLSPRRRFLVEILCCAMAAEYFGVRLDVLGELWPGVNFSMGWMALPVTVFGLVGVINAFNMTDGVDGLAGGLAFLIFGSLAYIAYDANSDIALQLMSIAVCLLGFLFFNSRFFGRAKAVIFMGDGGTLFVGFAIGWYLVLLSQGERAVIRPVSALWLFGVPLLDTISVMIRRIRRGQSPFHADREHLHHIFLLAGFGVNRTVLIILAFQVIFTAFAIFGLRTGLPEWVSFWSFIALFACYYWCMSHAWKLMKRIRSFREWATFEDRRHVDHVNSSGRRSGVDRRENHLKLAGADRRKIPDRREAEDRRMQEKMRIEAQKAA
ncbi:MAG: undecaprenyl-phosphate alpha-N-acetylglucosaminyl 1-phosphate transferase [Bacteroidota bacterium]